jgi:hypothetical protein
MAFLFFNCKCVARIPAVKLIEAMLQDAQAYFDTTLLRFVSNGDGEYSHA